MKNKLLLSILTLLLCLLMAVTLVACGEEKKSSKKKDKDKTEQTPDDDETSDDDDTPTIPGHTHAWSEWSEITAPTCVEKGEKKRTCTCGAEQKRGIAIALDAHVPSTEWTNDETEHWHNCTRTDCTAKVDKARHDYNWQNVCTTCAYAYVDDSLVFSWRGDSYVASYYNGIPYNVCIPATYNGAAVTSIDGMFFLDYAANNLTSITIPASVTSIGDGAFSGCSSLTAVYITDLSAWCKIEFGDYEANPLWRANNLYVNGDLVTHLEIPNGVTSIKDYAFMGCTSITSVTIPASVTSIGKDAFSDCSSLTTVNFVDNSQLTSIGDWAFDGCLCLTSITIPAGVTSIGDWAFEECCYNLIEVYNLSALNIKAGSSDYGYVGYYAKNVYTPTSGESKLFTDSNGYIFYDDGTDRYLMGYTGTDTDLTLPASCNGNNYEIHRYVFYERDGLTSVTIPASVTGIGYGALGYCFDLTSITIPASVTSIGEDAFNGCFNLTTVYYTGIASDWNSITIEDNNTDLTSAPRYYYSATEPTTAGNWWYYDADGKPVIWGE